MWREAVSLAGENFDTINVVVQRLADLNMFIASASEQQARMAADVAEMIGDAQSDLGADIDEHGSLR